MFPAPQFLRRRLKAGTTQQQRTQQALLDIQEITGRVPGERGNSTGKAPCRNGDSETLRNSLATTLRRIHQDIADLERAIATIRPLVAGSTPAARTSGVFASRAPIRRIRVPTHPRPGGLR